MWVSNMQAEIALSSAEAEYVALSQSMREVLPLLRLHGEIQERGEKVRLHLDPNYEASIVYPTQ